AELPHAPASPRRRGRDVRARRRAGPPRCCTADARRSGLQDHRGGVGPRILRSGPFRARLHALDGPGAARVPAAALDRGPAGGARGRERPVYRLPGAAIPGATGSSSPCGCGCAGTCGSKRNETIGTQGGLGMNRIVTLLTAGLLVLTVNLARAAEPDATI